MKSLNFVALIACIVFMPAIPGWAQTRYDELAAARAEKLDQAEVHAVVEKAGELLTKYYIFPDRAADAKAKIDAVLAAGGYDFIVTPNSLADKLTSDLQSVTHDKHVQIFPPRPPTSGRGMSAFSGFYAGFERVDRLKGNIGYIKLGGFPAPLGPFGETADRQWLTWLAPMP